MSESSAPQDLPPQPRGSSRPGQSSGGYRLHDSDVSDVSEVGFVEVVPGQEDSVAPPAPKRSPASKPPAAKRAPGRREAPPGPKEDASEELNFTDVAPGTKPWDTSRFRPVEEDQRSYGRSSGGHQSLRGDTGRVARPQSGSFGRPNTGRLRRPSGAYTRPATGRQPRPPSGANPRPAGMHRRPSGSYSKPRGSGRVSGRASEFYGGPGGDAGHAICPACQAENVADALRCARCAAELPRATPTSARAAQASPGMGVQGVPRESVEADDGVLPGQIRHQLERRRQDQAERKRQAAERFAAQRGRWIVGLGVGFMLGGLAPSWLLLSGWWLLGIALLDLVIGGAAARWLLSHDVHTVDGQLAFGTGALVSLGAKCTLGFMTFGQGLIPVFLTLVGALFVAVLVGGLVGRTLEARALDDAF